MILRSFRKGILRGVMAAVTAVIIIFAMFPMLPVYASTDVNIPTLTAVVNNGMLTVNAVDDASGIVAIYVNGFEFTDLDNGSLTIRMQQYDTGYQYFTMQAKDGAGNMSEVYRVNNPYYSFPDDDHGEEIGGELPEDADPTKPSDSEADVTDHVKTDDDGNETDRRTYEKRSSSSSIRSSSSSVRRSSSSSKYKEPAVEDDDENDYEIDRASKITDKGREFYTITTKTGKVFYLVIDRAKDAETVHFLTDITENDLLNVTEDNKPTLPQNSAMVVKDAGLQDVSAGAGKSGKDEDEAEDATEESDFFHPAAETVSAGDLLIDGAETEEAETEAAPEAEEVSPAMGFLKKYGSLLAVGIIGVIVVIGYCVKKFLMNGNDEDYMEDEEADDEDDLIEEEEKEGEDDFFAERDDEETGEAPHRADSPQGEVKNEEPKRESLKEEIPKGFAGEKKLEQSCKTVEQSRSQQVKAVSNENAVVYSPEPKEDVREQVMDDVAEDEVYSPLPRTSAVAVEECDAEEYEEEEI